MNNFIMLPNNLLGSDERTIELYYWIIYNQNKFGNTNVSVNWLLPQTCITNDKNNKNKRFIKDLFNFNSYDEVKSIDVNSLYEYNQDGNKSNFTIIYCDEHDSINHIQLFKYFFYIARYINNSTMYMGHSINQIKQSLGFSKNTITEYNSKLKDIGVIDYVNTTYYSSGHGHNINYTNFYTLAMRVDDSAYVLNKAIKKYSNDMENFGLKLNDNLQKERKRINGIISYYGNKDYNSLTKEQQIKYTNALDDRLKMNITDWGDNSKEVFINGMLLNRYSKFNFDYDICEQLFNGELKIYDAIQLYGERE